MEIKREIEEIFDWGCNHKWVDFTWQSQPFL